MSRMGSATNPSIINAVLGPITLGPSSSHLAGPLRIGLLGRSVAEKRIEHIEITFNEGGSLAGTYRGHRTDCAIVAGALGWDTYDERIPQSRKIARESGIEVSISISPLETDHPNAIRLRLGSDGDAPTEIVGTSQGGGMALVSSVDGYQTHLDGEQQSVLLWLHNPGDREKIASILPEAEVRCADRSLLTLAVPTALSSSMRKNLRACGVGAIREIPPVVPPPGPGACEQALFRTADEALQVAHDRDLDLFELGLHYEMNRQGWSPDEVQEHAHRILAAMTASRDRGLSEKLQFSGGIVRQSGTQLMQAVQEGRTLTSGAMGRAMAYATAINEVNAAMGVIAAAPTAGGCGVLPGALLAAAEDMNNDDEDALMQALLAAGAVGAIFAQQVTFLAELCGCQVESGAGSAMAAGAIIWLRGGTIRQSLDGAAITLQNILGMECDPVAGLMEVPCITRNALGAANAIMTSDMVLVGAESVIPLDEVLDAVYETGRIRPVQCSGTGGLAITPTSRRLVEQFFPAGDGE